MSDLRSCFREPIPEIAIAAQYLDAAVTAHLKGKHEQAATLIKRSDMPIIRDWTESIWGKNSPYVSSGGFSGAAPVLTKEQRVAARMPNALEKKKLMNGMLSIAVFAAPPSFAKKSVRNWQFSTRNL